MSLKELQLPSIASLRATAALRSPHLALVRPARLGLGFESDAANQKTLAEVEALLGGPGRLPLPYALRWLLDGMTGLGVLHRTLGFVHGEVQPDHLVLGEDGVGRLIPVVRAHWVRGEPRATERLYYLAPEKLLGDGVDVRSDVFSVGVMLWEALAGQRLLEADTIDDIIARLMGGGIPRVVPPEGEVWAATLSAIAERAIAIDPARRFGSIAEMKDAIEGACVRHVTNARAMVELFRDPLRLASNDLRASIPPQSQRATKPPPTTLRAPAAERDLPVYDARLDAAAERLSRSSFASIDFEDDTAVRGKAPSFEEETIVRPSAFDDQTVVRPQPAPLLLGTKSRDIEPARGDLAPVIERDSAPDSITSPFSRIPSSAPAPSTAGPPRSAPTTPALGSLPAAVLEARRTSDRAPAASDRAPAASDRAPAASDRAPAASQRAAISSAPPEPRRPVALAPLVAAPVRASMPVPEPSFELIRPRKRHGARWLIVGAALAIGGFAARSWLARQVTSATSGAPDEVAAHVDTPGPVPSLPSASMASKALPEMSAQLAVSGTSSVPVVPSGKLPASRSRTTHEEHVVIHDSVEPIVSDPVKTSPIAAPPPVVAPTPAANPTPAAPTPTPKAKPVPVSDADRYGI